MQHFKSRALGGANFNRSFLVMARMTSIAAHTHTSAPSDTVVSLLPLRPLFCAMEPTEPPAPAAPEAAAPVTAEVSEAPEAAAGPAGSGSDDSDGEVEGEVVVEEDVSGEADEEGEDIEDMSAAVFMGHEGPVYCVTVSADGALAASGDGNDTAFIWRPSDGELLHTLKGHKESVSAIAFNRSGSLLATADLAGAVMIWSPTTGELLRVCDCESVIVLHLTVCV